MPFFCGFFCSLVNEVCASVRVCVRGGCLCVSRIFINSGLHVALSMVIIKVLSSAVIFLKLHLPRGDEPLIARLGDELYVWQISPAMRLGSPQKSICQNHNSANLGPTTGKTKRQPF